MSTWEKCKRILCVRADNMGDVIMSGPAMRALKESLQCSVTLLTSSMGALIAPYLDCLDETMVYDLPWVKGESLLNWQACLDLVETIREKCFDAAVVFTTYSQSALPAAMLAFMAGIPRRLAYCRENPYGLLTHWLPDKEPYDGIVHQVERDLRLIGETGAGMSDNRLFISVSEKARLAAAAKLEQCGVELSRPFIIVHTGVSEKKREYPADYWIAAIKLLNDRLGMPVLLTGSEKERKQAKMLANACGGSAFIAAGLFTVEEFAAVVDEAALAVTVNTATVHIAAAVGTPVVVLYALTNPQHTPWKVPCRVLPFAVAQELRSRNEVVNYVSKLLHRHPVPFPSPEDIVASATDLLQRERVPSRTGSWSITRLP